MPAARRGAALAFHITNRSASLATLTSGNANGANASTHAAPIRSASTCVSMRTSKRLDLDLAEFGSPARPLEGNGPARELGVARVDGLHAVQDERDLRAHRRDLVHAPLAADLRRRLR